MTSMMRSNTCGWAANLLLMVELRKRILTFRDVIDLPPCDGSGPIHELVMDTVEDLYHLYPKVVNGNLTRETEDVSLYQELHHLYDALKAIGDSWVKNHKWISTSGYKTNDSMEDGTLEQLSKMSKVLSKLNNIIDIARKMFDVMEEDEKNNGGIIQDSTTGDSLRESYSNKKNTWPSPDTPAAFSSAISFPMELAEFANSTYASPLLLPLRLQAVEKLRPIEIKYLPFNLFPTKSAHFHNQMKVMDQKVAETKVEKEDVLPAKVSNIEPKDSKNSYNFPNIPSSDSNMMSDAKGSAAVSNPPPLAVSSPAPIMLPDIHLPPVNPPSNGTPAPPLVPPSVGLAPVSPIPMPPAKGATPPPVNGATPPPPPPPLGVAKAPLPRKNTKLKRSSYMGNMYRLLKEKVEGCGLRVKPSEGRKPKIGGGPAGGKQGMADALAEMTKRSAYFQQIEEDVKKHAKSIKEIKAAINSFQTKDMTKLVKFHKYVEQHLEKLTDETQVLARFEGFPTKKLETLRAAAALHLKLEEITTQLEKWKVMPPLDQHLSKVESYFNKIKGEIDALERSKDEESKRFRSNNIDFDSNILVRTKELMVDVSSNCMEVALKEWREAKEAESAESGKIGDGQLKASENMLWRAFQLAYRVYSFAGGQDERADILSKELAREIEMIARVCITNSKQ
ncbi:hypothetical protein P3X46_019037 [Hevea brasiliensis]|uniref:Hydroxyproline-rich glycoprotein family protein n=2 Tax=Hevea brasiliensis TaxID=3981 RepID=A0ABQ9LSJ8_HEVBR|nr:hypothetical protein P3X46_019037 [Hevea brasiliensis]